MTHVSSSSSCRFCDLTLCNHDLAQPLYDRKGSWHRGAHALVDDVPANAPVSDGKPEMEHGDAGLPPRRRHAVVAQLDTMEGERSVSIARTIGKRAPEPHG